MHRNERKPTQDQNVQFVEKKIIGKFYKNNRKMYSNDE